MPIYKIENNHILPLERTTFAKQGLRERQNLQIMLKSNISVISPDTLIVAEEFGDWENSRHRIDLLGIDKSANLVVIELKRTEDGGHMELQALRYAAMISVLTFDKLTLIYQRYLNENNIDKDAADSLFEFLDWNDSSDGLFGQEVSIILASAEFSKELTTTVIWLNDNFGLGIKCVRMHPYSSEGKTLLDIQTIVPIPEAADYQIRISAKKQKEREARISSKDFTKFDLSIAGNSHKSLNKRWLVYQVVSGVINNGGSPFQLMDSIPWRKNRLFEIFDETLDENQVSDKIMESDVGGAIPRTKRYFVNEGEFFHYDGKTFVLSNQWGNRTDEFIVNISEAFPELNISFKPTE